MTRVPLSLAIAILGVALVDVGSDGGVVEPGRPSRVAQRSAASDSPDPRAGESGRHVLRTTCHEGACDLECAPGWADCDHEAASGCEVDVLFDDASCGGCGTVCKAGLHCVLGQCQEDVGARTCLDAAAVPPPACDARRDPISGDGYVVCGADCKGALLSSQSPGLFHADAICRSLGYARATTFGGSCGHTCGDCREGHDGGDAARCGDPRAPTLDGHGALESDGGGRVLGYQVTWRCER